MSSYSVQQGQPKTKNPLLCVCTCNFIIITNGQIAEEPLNRRPEEKTPKKLLAGVVREKGAFPRIPPSPTIGVL